MYKENPWKNQEKTKKMDFAIFAFWDVSGQVSINPGFLGRFQYRTPRFRSSSPNPDSFLAENVFFSMIFAVFQLSLFAPLHNEFL